MHSRFMVLGALLLLALTASLVGSTGLKARAGRTNIDGRGDQVRVEQIDSPQFGLPDQTFQNVAFTTPIIPSLVVVNDRGGTGHKSFLVSLAVETGGAISFSQREGLADVMLPLAQQIPISGVNIRCDSFSTVNCQYTITLVGRSETH